MSSSATPGHWTMANRGNYHNRHPRWELRSIIGHHTVSAGTSGFSQIQKVQKDNLPPRPQIIERAGYLPSSTRRQDTDQFGYEKAPDPITKGGAVSASNPPLRGRSVVAVVKGLSWKQVHVGSRALQLGRKWVHYLGIILYSSVQGSRAIGMAI